MRLAVLLVVMLLAGCTGAASSDQSADGEADDGGTVGDLGAIEAAQVYTGTARRNRRSGAVVALGDEVRVLDLGRACVSDREAVGRLCTSVDEPSAAGVVVEVALENRSGRELRLGPDDATMYAGALPAETADLWAGQPGQVAVSAGNQVTGTMVWVLSGAVDQVVAAMDRGDYGFEVVVRGPEDEAVVTSTALGELMSEAPTGTPTGP